RLPDRRRPLVARPPLARLQRPVPDDVLLDRVRAAHRTRHGSERGPPGFLGLFDPARLFLSRARPRWLREPRHPCRRFVLERLPGAPRDRPPPRRSARRVPAAGPREGRIGPRGILVSLAQRPVPLR